jgi:beta-glucanase (GH16 family)
MKKILLILVLLLTACTPVSQKILNTAIPTATPVPPPFGQSGAWNLIFNDEFDGTTLDLSKWKPNWFGANDTSITNPPNTNEYTCYNPANVSLVDGSLKLSITPNTDPNCHRRDGSVAPYQSGLVSSNQHFQFTYGYFEARIWSPAGVDHKSVWPSFWTDGQHWPQDGEIDVLEAYGTDQSVSYHYHYSGGGPGGNSTVVGSTTGYHIYAANWEPGKITWYYDGKQVWQYTTGIISVPHYLMLNLAVAGTQVQLPASQLVDYVRVWKSVPVTGTPPTPTLTPTRTPTPTRTVTPTKTNIPTVCYPVMVGGKFVGDFCP